MISVLLADDNLIVREGVRAMLSREPDIEVVAVAADHDELLTEAERTLPQVVVTDIRMPPDFQRELDGGELAEGALEAVVGVLDPVESVVATPAQDDEPAADPCVAVWRGPAVIGRPGTGMASASLKSAWPLRLSVCQVSLCARHNRWILSTGT